jgi:hypothetical protein
MEGFKDNRQISICAECLEKRESLINHAHDHQTSFKEPWNDWHSLPGNRWLRTWVVYNGDGKQEYDNFLFPFRYQAVGGGGSDIVFGVFGVLGTVGTFASISAAVYTARRQLQTANSVGEDAERAQQH